jgi:hypothetical protein
MNPIKAPLIGTSGRGVMFVARKKEGRGRNPIRCFDFNKALSPRLVERKNVVTGPIALFLSDPPDIPSQMT